jgi:cysteine desulfurase/selenocysteine lyase
MKNPAATVPETRTVPDMKFDVERIRQDFPILQKKINGNQLVYFDNAATTQKPIQVIESVQQYYREQNANIHRGVHYLSQLATQEYEAARSKACRFLNAASPREIVFTGGTTDGINLVANALGRSSFKEGDEIIISHMEHHSNIVPWQILCEITGARLRIVPINDDGELVMEAFETFFNDRTRLVAMVHYSNSLGTINPVEKIIATAHENSVPVLIDGAQAVPHTRVDVRALDCDFYVFSGHKLMGPTGIGVLYGKEQLLDAMPPFKGGGDMILSVSFEGTTYAELPAKFEAGTPNIAGAVGLGRAIDYVTELGYDNTELHEKSLLDYATNALMQLPEVSIIGNAGHKTSVISFVVQGVHPHDVGTILDQHGIAVRTGHHCTQPVMDRFNVPATTRASLAFYNTTEEVDKLIEGLKTVVEIFG